MYVIWFMISEKSITRCKFQHRTGAPTHQKSYQTRHAKRIVYQNFYIYMNMCILTEGRNFKAFLKANYAIVSFTNNCYDVNSGYGACKQQTFLNFTADLMNTMQFKQFVNLYYFKVFLICLWVKQISDKPGGSRTLENGALAVNEIRLL